MKNISSAMHRIAYVLCAATLCCSGNTFAASDRSRSGSDESWETYLSEGSLSTFTDGLTDESSDTETCSVEATLEEQLSDALEDYLIVNQVTHEQKEQINSAIAYLGSIASLQNQQDAFWAPNVAGWSNEHQERISQLSAEYNTFLSSNPWISGLITSLCTEAR